MNSTEKILTRTDLEEREEATLAHYAMLSRQTRGRRFPEQEDAHRTVYRRDRDRIIHTSAFRRLEYKTQVFVNLEGDYYRTRLTHSLEVAQIAGTLSRMLRLNEDLVEVLSLAHDLGHPPFGHAGEDALHELMISHGGFDHNLQGLRTVDQLEARYPNFSGLNLSWEVREGINKHRATEGFPGMDIPIKQGESALMESQISDMADEIAYDNHDLDDGLTSGILCESDLEDVPMWRQARALVEEHCDTAAPEIRRYQIIRALINQQVSDLVHTTADRIEELNIVTLKDVRNCPQQIVSFSQKMRELRAPLKQFLHQRFYHHYRVARMADKAQRLIHRLFEHYVQHPDQLPGDFLSRKADHEPVQRLVCDYIASLTDRSCLQEYARLFEPMERV